MVISELVSHLEKLKKEEGDIDVYTDPPSSILHYVSSPDVRYCIKGKEGKFDAKMWNWFDGPWKKGKKFIRII